MSSSSAAEAAKRGIAARRSGGLVTGQLSGAGRSSATSSASTSTTSTSRTAGGKRSPSPSILEIQGILHKKKFKAEQKEKSALAQVNMYHSITGLKAAEDFTFADVSSEYISKLADYMANHACDRRAKQSEDGDNNGKLISLSSAIGYMSAYKMYLIRRQPDERMPEIFEENRWRGVNACITAEIVERCRKSNTNICNPHEKSTTEDRKGLATVCMWEGTTGAFNYHFLCTTMAQCAGRGSEVAGAHAGNLSLMEVHEGENIYKTFCLNDLLRNKTTTVQNLAIFCHRDSVLLDWFFAAAASLATSTESQPLFPQFFEQVKESGDEKKFDSQVSKKWESFYKTFFALADQVCKDFEDLAESNVTDFLAKMNPDLSSHCQKKHTLQKMAESPILNAVAACFRAGFMMKNVSTFFDYATTSSELDKRAAKVCSDWTLQDPFLNTVGGGRPPKVEDVTTASDKLELFVEELFRAHQNIGLEPKRLLAATLLRYYDDFIEVLEADPRGKFTKEDKSDHPLVARVHSALLHADANLSIFGEWKKEVKAGFVAANFNHLSIKAIEGVGGQSVLVDPRSLAQLVGQIGTAQEGCNQMMQLMLGQMNTLQRSVNTVLEKLGDGANMAEGQLPSLPTYFAYYPPGSKEVPTLSDLFYKWYYYDLNSAWDKEKGKKVQKARNNFLGHKSVVRLMLKLADSHPAAKPTESHALTIWSQSLKTEADALEKKVAAAADKYGIKCRGGKVTRNTAKNLLAKAEVAVLPLPPNTPKDSPFYAADDLAGKQPADAVDADAGENAVAPGVSNDTSRLDAPMPPLPGQEDTSTSAATDSSTTAATDAASSADTTAAYGV